MYGNPNSLDPVTPVSSGLAAEATTVDWMGMRPESEGCGLEVFAGYTLQRSEATRRVGWRLVRCTPGS